MIWSMIEMSIDCPECDAPVHVDGPYRQIRCSRCQSIIDFPAEVWGSTLEDLRSDVADLEKGMGSNSTIFGHFNMKLTRGNLLPYCMNCKRDFDLETDVSEQGMLTCPDCGESIPFYDAPDWFSDQVKGAKVIAGAWPEGGEGAKGGAVSDPVAYTCPKCGGSLEIDGKARLIKCDYCSTNIYLPDDLWLTLHPAKKKNRWFIGFA